MKKVKLTRKEWLVRNIALPVALIQRPLRYIASQTNTKDEKGNTVLSPTFIMAHEMAQAGQGGIVQAFAREVARGA